MFTYVSLITWTDEGLKAAKESVARAEGARQAIEQAGGSLVGIYWLQGQYDALAITTWPDEETAMAMALLVGMGGNDRIETIRAFSAEDMQRIYAKMP